MILCVHTAFLDVDLIGTRVLKHNKEVEIKQFSEEFIYNVSRLSMRSAPLRGGHFVFIFVYIMKSVFYLIFNHNLCISIMRIHYILIISDVLKDLSGLGIETQTESRIIYIMNLSARPHFNSVFNLQINYSENCLF